MNFNFPDQESQLNFIECRDYLLNISNMSYEDLTPDQKVYQDEMVFKYLFNMLSYNKVEILNLFRPKTYEIF